MMQFLEIEMQISNDLPELSSRLTDVMHDGWNYFTMKYFVGNVRK